MEGGCSSQSKSLPGLGQKSREEIITLKDLRDVKPTQLSNSEMLWERGTEQHVPQCLQADYPKARANVMAKPALKLCEVSPL